jgi:hypothetical protein
LKKWGEPVDDFIILPGFIFRVFRVFRGLLLNITDSAEQTPFSFNAGDFPALIAGKVHQRC